MMYLRTSFTHDATGDRVTPLAGRSFVDALLHWYGENGRHELPWREDDRSAFEILVAEVLLQRTTASAVSGAYVPFTALYPTPACVVAAPSSDLVERIAPLGLAKRADHLERCSGQLLARHGGEPPRHLSDLVNLHGIGEYSARSVMAHAFDEETAAVDTNVRRLISRYFGVDPELAEVNELADALAPPGRSSDFLHAMLDFAAAVCTARSPACQDCSLEARCDWTENSDIVS